MNKILKRIKLIIEGKSLKDKLKIFFSVLTINQYKPEVSLKNKDGIFFVRKNSADLWMLSTLGEDDLRKYFKLDKGVFLDIGANVGKYSVILGKQLKDKGKVFSFEPEPSNLQALIKNLKSNNLTNVKIIPLACSDKKAILNFYINKNNSGGHSLKYKTNNKISVEANTLDNLLKPFKLKRVDLMKIDVEGAESDVLKGAIKPLKKFHPKIIFEAWDDKYLQKCLDVLKPLGYKVKKISEENYLAI